MTDSAPFGFLNINKPLGITSHDVVAVVRRTLKLKRVGHAGTLDPLASGVLVVCVGTATRLSEYVMASRKVYRAVVRLGVTTTTYDAAGDIIAQHDATHLSRAHVDAALPAFIGHIEQLPPMYSAIKKDGKKLYELARAGIEIERQARPVYIASIEIEDWALPDVILRVTCGSGTYIRSLAHDLGAALGVGGSLVGLVRTASGAFDVAQAVDLETFRTAETPAAYLIAPRQALSDYLHITLDAPALDDVAHGRMPALLHTHADDTLAMAFSEGGILVAVLIAQDGKWKPHKVISGTGLF